MKPQKKQTDDERYADLRRMVRGLQKAMAALAELDPDAEDYAIELGKELESKRRQKNAIAKLGEKV